MPLYEYQCGACGHRLEALQKIADDPLVYCPECNEAELKKLISAAAFRLKGTGWYETDFKTKQDTSKSGKEDSSKDQKADSKSESSSDNKTGTASTGSSDTSAGSSKKTNSSESASAGQSASA